MGNNCCTYDFDVPTLWFYDFAAQLPGMSGKRVAITGCTTGLGFFAAQTCVQKGAEVFILNRDSERAEKVLKQLQAQVSGSGAVHHISCDLSDFASVRAAAATLFSKCERGGLDVLCCNAGIANVPDAATKDGFNVQVQTNVLSHFLLTKEVFPALETAAKERGDARIITHSSYARIGKPLEAAFFGKNGGKLGDGKSWQTYQQTKLAALVFAYALEAKLTSAGSSVKAICCAPGVAATNIATNMAGNGGNLWSLKLCSCLMARMIQSSEDGTMPLLQAIAGQNVASGDFLLPSMGHIQEWKGPVRTMRRPLPAREAVCEDRAAQEMLWLASEEAVGGKFL